MEDEHNLYEARGKTNSQGCPRHVDPRGEKIRRGYRRVTTNLDTSEIVDDEHGLWKMPADRLYRPLPPGVTYARTELFAKRPGTIMPGCTSPGGGYDEARGPQVSL